MQQQRTAVWIPSNQSQRDVSHSQNVTVLHVQNNPSTSKQQDGRTPVTAMGLSAACRAGGSASCSCRPSRKPPRSWLFSVSFCSSSRLQRSGYGRECSRARECGIDRWVGNAGTQQLATGGAGRLPAARQQGLAGTAAPTAGGAGPPPRTQTRRAPRSAGSRPGTAAQRREGRGARSLAGAATAHALLGRVMHAHPSDPSAVYRSGGCAIAAPTSSSNAAAGPSERRRLAAAPAGSGAARLPEAAGGAPSFSVSMGGPQLPCDGSGLPPGAQQADCGALKSKWSECWQRGVRNSDQE